ncbi:MAG: hypothetical protein R3C16_05640 [Hyphomonadaceae bacterium]
MLVSVGCTAVACLLMVMGQRLGSAAFPVYPEPASSRMTIVSASEDHVLANLVPIDVPFGAFVVHIAAGTLGALLGGYLAARLAPRVLWPVSLVGGGVAALELLAAPDIHQDLSFKIVVSGLFFACAWLGAAISQIGIVHGARG